MPFQYKKVLVLGATSGIGWAMAKKFLDEGSSVIAVGRRAENLKKLAEEHGAEGQVDTAVFDITDLKGIPEFVNDIASKHPDLDCVFLNSGMQRHLDWKDPESVDLDVLETEFTTNYLSYMHLTKAFLPVLQKKAPQETALVYITSGLALAPIVYCPNYCASKAALHHMVMMLRLQMKEINSNVKIIEVLPPAVQTELHDDKHQPEFQGKGRHIGMPLADFVEEAYAGLAAGTEQIPVQMTKRNFDTWEQERQKNVSSVKHFSVPCCRTVVARATVVSVESNGSPRLQQNFCSSPASGQRPRYSLLA
ncbi:putative oxidoreductase DltE [Cercospora beticola]|uniref:Putative oxidoreductase DltE n=1 Tax=Cercospora beticola TaxID=122368 RepID=A0A2G5H7Y7_CERBT|nr:putative oxidoreductase DltE [Cercospora beticola]PIA88651.1 putative oxidoreductase DltE [Cercospora beticola]